ncbi:MAG: YeeE/YedE thiosulfate transporter family protein, partial [Gaiellaceae bacterium]
RGPGDEALADLDAAGPLPSESALHTLLDAPYGLLAPVLGAVALALLLRRSRSGLLLGIGVGLVGAAAWVAADWAGYGYGLGFTGAADNARDAIVGGDFGRLSFLAFLATGVVVGAALALRGPLRIPDRPRALRALAGGVLMGLGANAAHGCNIGHGLTGLSLLSLGSLLATALMAAGALLTWRLLLAPLPSLRGAERPEPSW